MVEAVNLNANSLRVDDRGRVSVSGVGSGIDYQTSVDMIMKARRIPVDRLESRIEDNDAKIAAYQELRALMNGLQTSLRDLRGAVSLGNATNAFAAKQAFATVSRTDGGTASTASSLLGVSLTNAAAAGSHTIDVLQTAAAHKISSDAFASTTAALGFADGDQFTVAGKTVAVSAGDNLLSLRDRINAANTGSSPSGVTASIVSVSSNQHFLVLTKDQQGSTISLTDGTGSPLADVGLLTGGGAVKNLLQAPRMAQIYADGLLDQTNKTYESARLASGSVTLGSNGTIRFADGVTTHDLAYTSGQSVATLAANINADATLQTMGISASVATEGGQVRLKIVGTGNAFTMTETGGGSALTALAIDNSRQLIERSGNTISDLLAGVTLTLFQAEVGSTVKIDIERNLSGVKTQVESFVAAYNELKTFFNAQTFIDPTTGDPSEDALLLKSRSLKDIETQINQILGRGTLGVSDAFTVLAQIGVTFVDNAALSDPLLADTLQIDAAKLDAALLNSPDDVRRLFAFDFSASDPRVTLLGFTSATRYDADGFTLNVGPIGSAQETSGAVESATALLNDAVNGVGATTSGQFTLNGSTVAYDVTVDTLEALATRINGTNIAGVRATVITDDAGDKQLRIDSTTNALSLSGDTGNLLSNLGLTTTATLITRANIGGAADGTDNGTVRINGMTITVLSGSDAEGLSLLYTGTSAASGIQLDYTVGVATDLYALTESALDPQSGAVESEISALTDQNEMTQERIDAMLARLESQRQSLLQRFLAMETALTSMNSLLENLRQSFDAMNNSKN